MNLYSCQQPFLVSGIKKRGHALPDLRDFQDLSLFERLQLLENSARSINSGLGRGLAPALPATIQSKESRDHRSTRRRRYAGCLFPGPRATAQQLQPQALFTALHGPMMI